MFCQWSSVSTISRTTLWQRYDKERLSIHCRKVSGKTKHFARYVPSVWLEGHSFLMSYWLSMSVLTIPTLVIFYYNITYSVFDSVFFYKSSCALGFFFCEVTAPMSNVKSCLVNNLPFKERVFFTSDLLFMPCPYFEKQKNLPKHKPKGLIKGKWKFSQVWQQQIRIACLPQR